MKNLRSITRTTVLIAWVLSATVAVILPAGFFLMSYQNLRGKLESLAEMDGEAFRRRIMANPGGWKDDIGGFLKLFNHSGRSRDRDEGLRIMAADGAVIHGQNFAPSPTLIVRHPVLHDGSTMATIEYAVSLRPLFLETSLVALLGLALGGGLFTMMRRLPLRTIEESEKALTEANDFLLSVMQSSTSAIMVMDRDGRVVMVNRKASSLTGRSQEELVGSAAISHFAAEARNEMADRLQLLQAGKEASTDFDSLLMGADGNVIPIACGAAPFHRDNRIDGFVISAEDITLRKKAEDQIRQLAYFDSLTGLPNRMLFHDRLSCTLAYAERYRNLAAIIFIDLDNFKLVNDSLGHRVGDLLLKEVAQRLQLCVRKSDVLCHYGDEPPKEMVARIGGDEFTILLTNIRQQEDTVKVMQRMFTAFSESFRIEGHELHVTLSAGISIYPADSKDLETLLKQADTAMYHAKAMGRNTFQFFRPAMNETAMLRLQTENSLHRALERQELMLHYQPQKDLQRGSIVGMEALLRWNHPERGLLMPQEFIPIAEETGLITPLTKWVLDGACRQNRLWHDQGQTGMRVSVNISAHLFKSDKLPALVESALEDAGLPSRFLELEITEAVMLHDLEHVVRQLQVLKEMGVVLTIDDFGTGYSSFNYLKLLPIDSVKIDRTLVHDLLHGTENMAIVRAIIAAAHMLDLKVVAEGVETQEQLALLLQGGCDEGQGYLMSRPVPASRATELLLGRNSETTEKAGETP